MSAYSSKRNDINEYKNVSNGHIMSSWRNVWSSLSLHLSGAVKDENVKVEIQVLWILLMPMMPGAESNLATWCFSANFVAKTFKSAVGWPELSIGCFSCVATQLNACHIFASQDVTEVPALTTGEGHRLPWDAKVQMIPSVQTLHLIAQCIQLYDFM